MTGPMRVMVALSGGVDSAVAAALLRDQGCEVMGATLKTFCYAGTPDSPKVCCGLEGVAAARAVAAQLGIPHTVWDVAADFQREVIDNFVAEYAAGRTPNPCVRCNATVKIPAMLERARALGCTHLATGHYARCVADAAGALALERGLDVRKDQAYFLWQVPVDVLPWLLLPIGGLTKPQIRQIAAERGFPNAQKAESQEICFVPEGTYLSFLRAHLPADHPGFQPGPLMRTDGTLIGRHEGYLGYTIGQRRGLGGGHGRRLYVTRIDPATRTVFAGEEDDLLQDAFLLEEVNSFIGVPAEGLPVEVQIRHRFAPVAGTVVAVDGLRAWQVRLTTPARAVTPGQSAVLFHGPRVLAGGTIHLT